MLISVGTFQLLERIHRLILHFQTDSQLSFPLRECARGRVCTRTIQNGWIWLVETICRLLAKSMIGWYQYAEIWGPLKGFSCLAQIIVCEHLRLGPSTRKCTSFDISLMLPKKVKNGAFACTEICPVREMVKVLTQCLLTHGMNFDLCWCNTSFDVSLM